jgi:hypothetical protein
MNCVYVSSWFYRGPRNRAQTRFIMLVIVRRRYGAAQRDTERACASQIQVQTSHKSDTGQQTVGDCTTRARTHQAVKGLRTWCPRWTALNASASLFSALTAYNVGYCTLYRFRAAETIEIAWKCGTMEKTAAAITCGARARSLGRRSMQWTTRKCMHMRQAPHGRVPPMCVTCVTQVYCVLVLVFVFVFGRVCHA